MRIPALRERVRVKGRKGVFLIVGVDREREVVDLISTTSGGQVEEDVAFASLLPADESLQPKKEGPADK